jgi:hypothetical protein
MVKESTSVNESLQSFWHLSSKEMLTMLGSDPDKGLTEIEVQKRLSKSDFSRQFGINSESYHLNDGNHDAF